MRIQINKQTNDKKYTLVLCAANTGRQEFLKNSTILSKHKKNVSVKFMDISLNFLQHKSINNVYKEFPTGTFTYFS